MADISIGDKAPDFSLPITLQEKMTLSDVLIRRTHVIYETQSGGRDRARAVAEVMAPRLGWDASEIERQVADYVAQVALTQQWRAE